MHHISEPTWPWHAWLCPAAEVHTTTSSGPKGGTISPSACIGLCDRGTRVSQQPTRSTDGAPLAHAHTQDQRTTDHSASAPAQVIGPSAVFHNQRTTTACMYTAPLSTRVSTHHPDSWPTSDEHAATADTSPYPTTIPVLRSHTGATPRCHPSCFVHPCRCFHTPPTRKRRSQYGHHRQVGYRAIP